MKAPAQSMESIRPAGPIGPVRWPRVILGGALAGVAVYVIQGVGSFVYVDELTHILAEHDLAPGGGPWSLVVYAGLNLAAGWATVWLYALLLPRYGPGFKAARIAGCGIWLLWFVPTALSWSLLGLFPLWIVVCAVVVAAVAAQAAALLAAWIYREPEWSPRPVAERGPTAG